MHGHRMRHIAEEERTERWTDFSVGSLYGALKRLAAEGLVEVQDTEQDGNLPPRTVYAITDTGHEELASYRTALLSDTRLRPDAVDLALQYSEGLVSAEELRAVVTQRRAAYQEQLESWTILADYAAPHLKGLESVIIRHTLLRLEAEVAWHDEVLAQLDP
jgi:DNA-binding PadR family transcriptional regulator